MVLLEQMLVLLTRQGGDGQRLQLRVQVRDEMIEGLRLAGIDEGDALVADSAAWVVDREGEGERSQGLLHRQQCEAWRADLRVRRRHRD